MKKKEKWNTISWIALGVIVVIVCLAITMLRGKKDYTSDGGRVTKVSALNCSGTHLENSFFVSESAQRYEHGIRIMLKGDKIDGISYIYEGVYNSAEAVEDAASRLHAKYNVYMGENNENPESLIPNFSNIKSKLKITLYADEDDINRVTAKLFFLTGLEVEEIGDYDASEIEKLYEDKGFSCVFENE